MKSIRHITLFFTLLLFAVCSLLITKNKTPGKNICEYNADLFSNITHETFKLSISPVYNLASRFTAEYPIVHVGLRLELDTCFFNVNEIGCFSKNTSHILKSNKMDDSIFFLLYKYPTITASST
jgi:hypothetical protein